MDTYTDFCTLGCYQLRTFLVADRSIIVSSCHYNLIAMLLQDIFQKKRDIQIQLIFRKAAERTTGSGRSFCFHGGGTRSVGLCGTHIHVFTLMSGINSYDVTICSRSSGIAASVRESLTTGFTENRRFGTFLAVFGFRCAFVFAGVVLYCLFSLGALLQIFVGCLFLFDLGCIKVNIFFHGFLLRFDRFDDGSHFLVCGINFLIGFVT